MVALELTVQTAVRNYHVYKDIWTLTMRDKFDCWQEPDNEEAGYAVQFSLRAEYSTTSRRELVRECLILQLCIWQTFLAVTQDDS